MTVALALPLNIPDRNVFYAFNFEANYNMPSPITAVETIIPGPLDGPLHVIIYFKYDWCGVKIKI